MTAETFFLAPQDNNQPSKTYSAEAGRDVATMVDNDLLKCTATLPLYITSESEFFRAFATLILWYSHLWVSML